MPRMLGDEDGVTYNRWASMRPRRECLGCRAGSRSGRRPTRRFNEAEARMPRMHSQGYNAPGNPDDASMRPRRECLGCLFTAWYGTLPMQLLQ